MTDKPTVYTAGAMDWENNEDSYWRASLDADVQGVEFQHPQESYFDHGGDLVSGAVAEDISMIHHADAVVALFTEKVQVGTLVEVLHAVHTGVPTLVLMDVDLAQSYGPRSSDPTTDGPSGPLGGVEMRGTARDYWFLLNYLSGDDVYSNRMTTGYYDPPAYVEDWDGFENATTLAVYSDDGQTISHLVERWASSGFEASVVDLAEFVDSNRRGDVGRDDDMEW